MIPLYPIKASSSGKRLYLGLCFGLLAAILMSPPGVAQDSEPPETEGTETEAESLSPPSARLFQRVFGMVLRDYVEPKNPGLVIRGALDGLAASTGPESAYIPPDLVAAYRALEKKSPRFTLPLYLTKGGDFARVIIPFPGQDEKILPSDALRTIDGQSTFDMSYPEILIALNGAEGEPAECTFLKQNEWDTYTVTLKRSLLPKAVWRIRPGGGVLVLPSLTDSVSKEILDGIKGSDKILLDLRGCADGNVDSAIAAAGLLLGEGKVTARGQHGDIERTFSGDGILKDKEVRVLIGATTARGGEILASALKNWDALLLGEETMGWAPLSEEFPLKNEGLLRINTAYFLAPDGEPINNHYIVPDLSITPEENETDDALYDRTLKLKPQEEPS